MRCVLDRVYEKAGFIYRVARNLGCQGPLLGMVVDPITGEEGLNMRNYRDERHGIGGTYRAIRKFWPNVPTCR